MQRQVIDRPQQLAYSERDLTANGILSRKTRWRMRRAGTFPQPVTAGGRKLYRAVDIIEWLENPQAWADAHEVRP